MSEASSAAEAGALEFTDFLVERLARGGCVLLLGPGVAVDPKDPDAVPLTTALARQLASEPGVGIPRRDRNRDNLRFVAEAYARARGHDRLERAVQVFYARYADATTRLHEDLAALPFALCIDTSPDALMVNALRARPDKRPRSGYYNFHRGSRVTPPAQPSVSEPLVYELYGSLEDRLSLVLTESDLLEFLVNVVRNEPELPLWMRALLAKDDTAFLFLGFGFQNWHVRVLLHALNMIDSESVATRHRGYALEDRTFFRHPEYPETVGFFENTGKHSVIRFQEVAWGELAAQLRGAWERAASAGAAGAHPPPPDAPEVFLSYASEDRAAADQLGRALAAHGLRVWQDRQNLRTGDDWEQKIEHVIGRQVDYVVVLQSAAMAARGEGVFNAEIDRALARKKLQGEGRRFLLPVTIDGTPPLERLRDLHVTDVRSEEGVDALALAIEDDRKLRAAKSAA